MSAKDSVIGLDEVCQQLNVAPVIERVVEDEDGFELDLGKVNVLLYSHGRCQSASRCIKMSA